MRGIQFAIDQANAKGGVRGNKIEVQFEDNQAKPDQSVLSFNKLVDLQHVPVIFTAYSGPTLAMAPLATRKKVLMVNAGAQADKLATASPYLDQHAADDRRRDQGAVEIAGRRRQEEGRHPVRERRRRHLRTRRLSGVVPRGRRHDSGAGADAVRPDRLPARAAEAGRCEAPGDAGFDHRGAAADGAAVPPAWLKFTVAGTTFFADPSLIADPSSAGFVHTQVRIDAPPELAAEFKAKYGADMEFFVRQYYNATQIVLTTLDKVLAEGKPVTGETMHDTLLQIRKFQGLIPLEFKTNTATVPIDINVMRTARTRR